MAEPNLASNNPFRRRPTIPQPPVEADAGSTPSPVPAASPSPQPSGDDFRRALTALPKSSEAPPSTTFQKPKPVKRVRVQSPPPSSPDSTEAEFEARFPASGHVQPPRHDENDSSSTSSSESESEAGEDPFRSTRPGVETEISGTSFPPSATRQRPPLNPFGRTLQDIEQGSGEAASDAIRSPGATAGKASLDVDSFRRLLMTGQSGGITAAPAVLGSGTHQTLQPPGPAGDAGSFTDASSISKQSIFEANQNPQETPRTSHEISEAEDDRRGLLLHTPSASSERTTLRKKPPPPSSRHGKLIKSQPKPDVAEPSRESTPRPTTKQLDDPASSIVQARRTSSSSDLNKPLPLPPQRPSVDGERESVFDKEAAGKVPEVDVDPDAPEEDIPSPRPPTPPNASHSTSAPVTATPAMAKPAPPPRRQAHYKPDPKASSTTSTAHEHPSTFPVDDEAAPPRSSMDSTHSRSSSFKANFSAPPPPPSRRSGHASKPSTSLVSPSVTSFASSISSPAILSDSERGQLGYSRAQGPTFEASSPPAAQTDGSAPDPISPPPQEKPSRPPPPPARHVSVRHKEHHRQADHFSATPGRPPSVVSVEAPTPPASRAGGIPPPPPPRPRQRGTSRGSTEVPDVIGRKSIDSVSSANRVRIADAEEGNGDGGGQLHHKGAVTEEQASVAGASGTGLEDRRDSHANDILADLDKLRREVDALRGAL